MCKAVGKKFNDYTRLIATQEFLKELTSVTGIPVTDLVIPEHAAPIFEVNTMKDHTWGT